MNVEELKEGDDLRVESFCKYTWKAKHPYKFIFEIGDVTVEPMNYLEGISRIKLDGKGI